jgi:hypothetical protein
MQPYNETTPMRKTVGDMSMTEIEQSLAAVEAALQDHSIEGSLDPVSLRRTMLPLRHASMLSTAVVTEGDLKDFEMLSPASPELHRVTLPPAQEVAIANAIKQVRRAISSSNLPQIPNEDESVSDFVPSNTLEPPRHSASLYQNESTPIRAARVRQESMQDVEEAYARMIDLVDTAAGIDFNSPLPNVKSARRDNNSSKNQTTSLGQQQGAGNLQYLSPGRKMQESTHKRTQSAIPIPSSLGSSTPSSRVARQQLMRESDALARSIAASGRPTQVKSHRETDEPQLRGRTSNMSLGSRRAISESPPRRPSEGDAVNEISQFYQRPAQSMQQIYKPTRESAGQSANNTLAALPIEQGRPLNGNTDGLLNAHNEEEGRYRGQSKSVPPPSMQALQKRHRLERDTLLDKLEGARTEATTLKRRNDDLRADLHQEVTRTLELQREMDRKEEVEATLLSRIADLERSIHLELADRLRMAELVRQTVARPR